MKFVRNFRWLAVSGLALLVGTGCPRQAVPDAKPAAAEALRAEDFYPLVVGNAWTYEDSAGSGTNARRTVRIVREEGGVFYDDQRGALRFDAAGLRDGERYLLKEPLVKGTTWSAVVGVLSTERYEIVEAGRPCSVPAGTFGACVVVRGTNRITADDSMTIEWTYAQGVGIVALRTVLQRGEGPAHTQVDAKLVSFELAK